MSSVEYCQNEYSGGNRYTVYKASSREDALTFLRKQRVDEERQYVVVETPEGNFGKDLIAIFNEQTEEVIELGERHPLPQVQKSMTRCARCGYVVLPAGEPFVEGAIEILIIDDLKKQGVGFCCDRCQTLWCPFCVSLRGKDAVCGICGSPMKLH